MVVIDTFSIGAVIISYLIGSVSSAIIICRFLDLPDPRTVGSKNAGTTNILRIAGKKWALLTLVGDLLKGVVAVMLGRLAGLSGFELGFVGFAVFLGHLYPVYFRFKGGKGVATFIGVLFVLAPWLAAAFLVTWLIVALIFRYSSLAGLTAAILSPFYALLLHCGGYFIPLGLMVLLILWRHRSNIKRLISGKESKIGQKKGVIKELLRATRIRHSVA